MSESVKRVLIAHQSTIPHYRVPFYEAVERLRSKWWEFCVVYDSAQAQNKLFLGFDHGSVNFHVRKTRTFTVKFAAKTVRLQTFLFEGSKYDLLVMGGGLSNLTYPISYLWRFFGKSVAYWGHGRDFSAERSQGLKALGERTKIWLTNRADGFFAYTNGVRDYMVSNGVDPSKVFVLHNTIDIVNERALFEKLIYERHSLRSQAGLDGKKVLLFVGRLTREKQLGVLLDAFYFLRRRDKSYHLLIIGGGDASFRHSLEERCGERSFTYIGATEDISRSCVMSDLYVLPGAIGLGPVHALCFDLTPVLIHSRLHKPEYEYISDDNALILPEGSTPEQYAIAIDSLLEDRVRWAELRAHAWPSIRHLTIENMARNFIEGINAILFNQDRMAN